MKKKKLRYEVKLAEQHSDHLNSMLFAANESCRRKKRENNKLKNLIVRSHGALLDVLEFSEANAE